MNNPPKYVELHELNPAIQDLKKKKTSTPRINLLSSYDARMTFECELFSTKG